MTEYYIEHDEHLLDSPFAADFKYANNVEPTKKVGSNQIAKSVIHTRSHHGLNFTIAWIQAKIARMAKMDAYPSGATGVLMTLSIGGTQVEYKKYS